MPSEVGCCGSRLGRRNIGPVDQPADSGPSRAMWLQVSLRAAPGARMSVWISLVNDVAPGKGVDGRVGGAPSGQVSYWACARAGVVSEHRDRPTFGIPSRSIISSRSSSVPTLSQPFSLGSRGSRRSCLAAARARCVCDRLRCRRISPQDAVLRPRRRFQPAGLLTRRCQQLRRGSGATGQARHRGAGRTCEPGGQLELTAPVGG